MSLFTYNRVTCYLDAFALAAKRCDLLGVKEIAFEALQLNSLRLCSSLRDILPENILLTVNVVTASEV